MRLRLLPVLAFLFLSASCSHYEYDVLQPPVSQPHVGTSEDTVVEQGPITYHMRSDDSRLVIRAFNSTGGVVQLQGVKSCVIDPTGQARALRSQPIPPGAFAKFILPPVRPEFVGSGGPRFGVGYGPGLGRSEFGYGYDEPERYTLRDAGEVYWDWKGESTARLILVYQVGGQEVTHEFALGRRRVK